MVADTAARHDGSVRWLRSSIAATCALSATLGLLVFVGPSVAGATSSAMPVDPTFGVAGVATYDLGLTQPANAHISNLNATTDDLGRALVAGAYASSQVVVRRMTVDGAIDTSFGDSGSVELPIEFRLLGRIKANAEGIVLAGLTLVPNAYPVATVIRLTPDGQPDPAFANGGILQVTTPDRYAAADASIDGTGRVVALLRAIDTSASNTSVEVDELRRYSPAGTPDPSFGQGGALQVAGDASHTRSQSLSADSAGRLLISTTLHTDSTGPFQGLMRVLPDGSVDGSFGDNGTVNLGLGRSDFVADLNGDGSIFIGSGTSPNGRAQLWRLKANGQFDPRFGNNGVADVEAATADEFIAGFARLPSGHIAVLASQDASSSITAIRPDGTVESSVEPNGHVVTNQSAVAGGFSFTSGGRLLATYRSAPSDAAPDVVTTEAFLPELPALAPSIDSVTSWRGGLSVRWEPPAVVTWGDALAYEVVALDGATVASRSTVAPDAREVSLTGLTNGTTYQVVVIPYSSSGVGLASAPASGTPTVASPAMTAAGPVRNVTASTGNGFATLSWALPDNDGGAPITAYSVIAINHVNGALAVWRNLAADVRSAAVAGLAPTVTYDLYVVPVTAAGFGHIAAPVRATPPACCLPSQAPEGSWVTAVVVGSSAIVNWGAPVEHGEPVTHFNVVVLQNGRMSSWIVTGPNQRQATVPLDPTGAALIYVQTQAAGDTGLLAAPVAITW